MQYEKKKNKKLNSLCCYLEVEGLSTVIGYSVIQENYLQWLNSVATIENIQRFDFMVRIYIQSQLKLGICLENYIHINFNGIFEMNSYLKNKILKILIFFY